MVDFLVKKDLMDRIPNTADGRSKLLIPTSSGQATVSTIETQLTNELSPLLTSVSDTDMESFKKVLQTIIDNE
jgi:DNA-binding MarR family transcriptional regulator